MTHFQSQGASPKDAETQANRMKPFLGAEAAVLGRLQELAPDLRNAVWTIALEHGGLLPLQNLGSVLNGTQANEFRSILQDTTLGTIGMMDLEDFGIRQRSQVVVIFQDVVLACMKHHAKVSPIVPTQTASIGVDFVSNFDRFANFVDDETVRFTVRGTIFKSTGKRLAERLLPNPGLEFGRLEILEMEYRFALAFRFIDRTGARSFRVTQAGKEFLALPLLDKQRIMLDCLAEDRDMPGDVTHQLPLRRLVLRVLKHFEPNQWIDAMTLPFLARSIYLASLQAKGREGSEKASFPVRSSADLNSLSWNLFTWVRKHLYLLGLVDMGYDQNGRACAVRLTHMGAEFLGMLPATDLSAAGHIVVNPDYEVVLFPGERSHELIYELDRFADREKSDSLYHYRITPASLHRALSEGMQLDAILKLLNQLSRTPLPQNVEYSLESWARSDGMVVFHPADAKLLCDSAEILDRISLHPELGRLGLERVDQNTLQICSAVELDPLTNWIRDYGVSVRIAS
ncbi:MAG: helicase-associated domain-containing protein [Planctomycetes bacterium]|nr:helicase-associated domain-containing protein [Planctomycetota bacterium]